MDKLPAMPPVPASYATTENVYTWPRAGGIKIVMHGDYDALRSVALAYLEALLSLQAELGEARKLTDELLNHCPDMECSQCGIICCPHKDPMHFHHDGCPSCAFDDAALSRTKEQTK